MLNAIPLNWNNVDTISWLAGMELSKLDSRKSTEKLARKMRKKSAQAKINVASAAYSASTKCKNHINL